MSIVVRNPLPADPEVVMARRVRRRHHPRGPGSYGSDGRVHDPHLHRCAGVRDSGHGRACHPTTTGCSTWRSSSARKATWWSSRSDTPSEYGFFGELLATALAARGVRGLVIDAGCRDIAELTAMGFPVWSKCVSAQGTVKKRLGFVNVPVTCAGASVEPGDVVVGDDDGIVIVPRAEAASVLAASKLREEKEARSRERYQRGELSLDVNDMRADLANLGLRYVDYEDAGR